MTPVELNNVIDKYSDLAIQRGSVSAPPHVDPWLWSVAMDSTIEAGSLNESNNEALQAAIRKAGNGKSAFAKGAIDRLLTKLVPDADATEGVNKVVDIFTYLQHPHFTDLNMPYDYNDSPDRMEWYRNTETSRKALIDSMRNNPLWNSFEYKNDKTAIQRKSPRESFWRSLRCSFGFGGCSKRRIGLSPMARYGLSLGK